MTSVEAAEALVAAGLSLGRRGWLTGTSGSLSVVVSRDPLRVAISRSGVDKAALTPEQVLMVDAGGAVVEGAGPASDETPLHLTLVAAGGAGAVVHTHSVWATILSDTPSASDAIVLEGYEMLKGLAGVHTHAHREEVPIFDNDQDYARLSARIREALTRRPACHGLLLRAHGLYTWGASVAEATRHAEVLEFLLEVKGRLVCAERGRP
jgi:methylthioribulose-1-phosphate dehydratase